MQAVLRLSGAIAKLRDILEKLIGIKFEEEPMLRLLDKPVGWGVEDSSVRVDEYLYGGGFGRVRGHGDLRSGEE